MRLWTYDEAKEKIEDELDLREENFIDDDELMGYFNDAIDKAEAQIHKLSIEDEYFTKSAPITLVAGEGDIALPSDIYANKIRSIIASEDGEIYLVTRLRGQSKFTRYADLIANDPDANYRYLLANASAAEGAKIMLAPLARDSSASIMTIWYIRNANRITTGTDVFDVPEAMNFIFAYVRAMCRSKENQGHMLPEDASIVLSEMADLVETLTEQVPDEDTTVVQDLSHYEEST